MNPPVRSWFNRREREIFFFYPHHSPNMCSLNANVGRVHVNSRQYSDMSNYWLVVWNMAFIFPYIGNHHPNWWSHIFQRGRSTTNQNGILDCFPRSIFPNRPGKSHRSCASEYGPVHEGFSQLMSLGDAPSQLGSTIFSRVKATTICPIIQLKHVKALDTSHKGLFLWAYHSMNEVIICYNWLITVKGPEL